MLGPDCGCLKHSGLEFVCLEYVQFKVYDSENPDIDRSCY